MSEKEVSSFFEDYLNQKPLFKNKRILQTNYDPDKIIHRKEEINKLASIMAPSLRVEKPSNVFLYGKTGTGKTLVTRYVANNLSSIAEKNKKPVKIFYLNCKLKRTADTEYRLVAEIARQFGKDVPATGLPTDEVYKIFLKAIDEQKLLLIIILDEIDQLLNKAGDEILYNLTRLSSELNKSEVSIIGISNDLMFTNYLDPRVRSSLSEEEILFSPYNAIQLKSILQERAKVAFSEGAIAEGVLEKCAAYAAREHGDARRALELLRVAGEITERKNEEKINISSLDEAEEKIERDRIYDIINTQPKQQQITLYSIFKLCSAKLEKPVVTGDVYELYKELCFKLKIRPLTQRRISDIIAELDMLGIINAKVISHGRYGRTRQICIGISPSSAPRIAKLLKEVLGL